MPAWFERLWGQTIGSRHSVIAANSDQGVKSAFSQNCSFDRRLRMHRRNGIPVTGPRKRLPTRGDGAVRRSEQQKKGSAAETARLIGSYKSGDRRYQAGQDLFSAGTAPDAFYNLNEGWVFLYNILENGRRQILHFAMPGAVLGSPLGPSAIATFGAQALTDVMVSVITHNALNALAKKHPDIGLQLARLISQDLGLAFDHLTGVGRQSARGRIARLLLELFMRAWAVWPGNGIEAMHIPLTQEHLGDATGLAAVHVNRILRGLQRDGVLEFHYRRLRILDPDKLIDVAGIDPEIAKSWFHSRPIG